MLDLRKCVYAGKSLVAKVLAGALMSDADLSGANLQEAVLTKVGGQGGRFGGEGWGGLGGGRRLQPGRGC
jgi:uncharacterized protein YjbI with pentapeptide repeats